MTRRPQPTPEQIIAYLTTHRWHESHRIGAVGAMYVYAVPDDDGKPIDVFVPDHTAWDDYPLQVEAVIDTLAALERRPWEDVRHDLLPTQPADLSSQRGSDVTKRPQPTPGQIIAYLTTHRWHESHRIGVVGAMYAYAIPDDYGKPLEVFVPSHTAWDDYPWRVEDVIDTLAPLERRPRENVRLDLLAAHPAEVTAAPHAGIPTTPAVPSGAPE